MSSHSGGGGGPAVPPGDGSGGSENVEGIHTHDSPADWKRWANIIKEGRLHDLRRELQLSTNGQWGKDIHHSQPLFGGRTLLHHACKSLRPEMVAMILEEAPSEEYIWAKQYVSSFFFSLFPEL